MGAALETVRRRILELGRSKTLSHGDALYRALTTLRDHGNEGMN